MKAEEGAAGAATAAVAPPAEAAELVGVEGADSLLLPDQPVDQELLLGLVAFWEALFARGFAAEVRFAGRRLAFVCLESLDG